MSSSEEYLDSLLDSILSGGKSEEEERSAAAEPSDALAEGRTADGGKAMSPDEIEEMLVSMGTLGGEEEAQESGSLDDMLAGSDDLALDDLSLDDLSLEDAAGTEGSGSDAIDELSLDDLDMNESGLDDLALDDLSLDSLTGMEEDALDGLSLDELSLDDSEEMEGGMPDALDDFSIDELSLDGLTSDEADGGAADALDELSLDDLSMGESGSDDFNIDELSLDDLSMEETENMEDDADGLMTEEEIDRLLEGDLSAEGDDGLSDFALEEMDGSSDDFALGEAGEGEDDLSALLAGMEHDEDLSEINDLLEESEQGVTADDDMLAMLEGVGGDESSFDLFESDEAAREAESIRELSPEEVAAREGGEPEKKEKKKRKKLFGKKKKGGEEETAAEGTDSELDALLGEVSNTETPQKEKKPGLFARLLDFLLESDEDDEDPVAAEILAGNAGETGTVTDENKELLQELSDEDKKGKKKKKKDKKGKKGKDGEEEGGKPKKEKKKKKEKVKKRKEEEVDLLAPPEKKLSKKKVITVFLFCGTIAAGIILFTTILPDTMQRREAQAAYDQANYAEVYDLLYGKELNEQDEVLFQGSNLVMQMDRRLTSYNNYVNLDMRLEALDALIDGVVQYHKILPEAENYNVAAEVNDIYGQILDRLFAEFGVSEEEALDLYASEDDLTYTQRLEAIINGEPSDEEEVETGIQDMLPEEEEIMERIGGVDGAVELEIEAEPEDIPSEEDQSEDEFLDEGAE